MPNTPLRSAFPSGGTDDALSLYIGSEAVNVTLVDDLLDTEEDAMILSDVSIVPQPGYAVIDNEIIGYFKAVTTGRVIELKRGLGGTSPAFHADGTGVKLYSTMGVVEGLRDAVIGLQNNNLTEAKTADYTLLTDDRGKIITNEGAGSQPNITLPPAMVNLGFKFYVQNAIGIHITATAGNTIRISGSVSAANGSADSTTVGDYLILVAINGNEWVALSPLQNWSLV